MTLGASGWPTLWGVPGPEAPALPAPPRPMMPCCAPNCEPPPVELVPPDWPGCKAPFVAALSPEGRGLLRESTNWVCEDEGVAWAELEGEFEAPCKGEEVPEVESFFLDDFSLLPLES
jgi:hypothetical protein